MDTPPATSNRPAQINQDDQPLGTLPHLRWPQRPRLRRFLRYAVGSAAATATSAVVFAVAHHDLGSGPRVASVAAFASGAVVNFVSNRFWAWGRRQRLGLGRDLVSYAVLAVSTALAAAVVTSLTEQAAGQVDPLAAHLTLVVEASYFATYAAMFLVKFVVLDRLVFRSRHQVPRTTRA